MSPKRTQFSDLLRHHLADNGKGFRVPDDLAELAQLGKLGIVGIRERIQLLDGRVNVESKAGKGTTIMVEVPV